MDRKFRNLKTSREICANGHTYLPHGLQESLGDFKRDSRNR